MIGNLQGCIVQLVDEVDTHAHGEVAEVQTNAHAYFRHSIGESINLAILQRERERVGLDVNPGRRREPRLGNGTDDGLSEPIRSQACIFRTRDQPVPYKNSWCPHRISHAEMLRQARLGLLIITLWIEFANTDNVEARNLATRCSNEGADGFGMALKSRRRTAMNLTDVDLDRLETEAG